MNRSVKLDSGVSSIALRGEGHQVTSKCFTVKSTNFRVYTVRSNWYMVGKKIKVLETFDFNLLFLEGQLLLWGVWEFAFSILAWHYDFFGSLIIRKAKPKAETFRRQLLHGWQITPSFWQKTSALILNFTCEITNCYGNVCSTCHMSQYQDGVKVLKLLWMKM